MLLDTHKWADEPMVLVSLGELKTQLGLPEQQRRFSFAQLSQIQELNRLAGEAHALRQAEKPLDQAAAGGDERGRSHDALHARAGRKRVSARAGEREGDDPWVVPPGFTTYYTQEQFAPVQPHLQAMANAYTRGDSFNFGLSAQEAARRPARA